MSPVKIPTTTLTSKPAQGAAPPPDADALDDLLRSGTVRERPRIGRFPLVWQIDEMDCGVACLAMICRHFGRRVGLAHLRELARTSAEGTTMRAIAGAATALGLSARTLKASARNLDRLPLPALVHVGGNHWACLIAVEPRRVRLADPAAGDGWHPRERFETALWTGFTVLVEPTPAFAAAPEEAPPLRRLYDVARPLRGRLARAGVFGAAAGAISAAVPLAFGALVDRVAIGRDLGALPPLLGAVFLALGVRFAAGLHARRLLAGAVGRLDHDTLDLVTRSLFDLPLRYFLERRTGDLERRLDAAGFAGRSVLGHGVQAATAAGAIVAAVTALLVLSPALGAVYLVVAVPLFAGLAAWFTPRVRPLLRTVDELSELSHSLQAEAVRRIEPLKVAASEDAFRERLLRRSEDLGQVLRRAEVVAKSYRTAVGGLSLVATAVVLGAGVALVATGALTTGALFACVGLAVLSVGPVTDLLAVLDHFAHAESDARRLVDVLESPPEPGGDLPVPTLSGAIEVRDLTLRYGGPESAAVLERVSFAVPAGARVALFGKSGAGKTSLLRCLAGVVEPSDGAILFDGIDARRLRPRELRRQVGFCLEYPSIFTGTIAENIALGEPAAEPGAAATAALERVAESARISGAHEHVVRLPNGYDTLVGEGGVLLSGGQRQRIAIARAVHRRPPVVILDEAFSALDDAAERKVRDHIDAAIPGSTVFVVSQRLSTLREADLVLVLDEGRLVEHGTHEELMARRGAYFYAVGGA